MGDMVRIVDARGVVVVNHHDPFALVQTWSPAEHSDAINRSYLFLKIDNQRDLFLFQGSQKLVGVRARAHIHLPYWVVVADT